MKRVLIVELAGSLWGSERALIDLIKGMQKMEVAVCCPPLRPIISELEKLSVRVLPYYVHETHKKTKWHRLWAAIGVLRACIEYKPDIIYLNQAGAYRVALPAATLMNLPIVSHIRIHGDADHIGKLNPSPSRLRALIAISKAIDREIRQIDALKAIPVFQIYDGYAPQLDWSRKSLEGLRAKPTRVACIGRIVAMKGQDVLIAALCLPGFFKNCVEVMFAGDGENQYVRELKEHDSEIRKAGNSVHWLGTQANVMPLLRECGVLAVPSYREALGRVIFEAWDAGTIPVVFAGSGGAAEIINASLGGILYVEQNAESIAKALQKALDMDEEAAARLIEYGRSWLTKYCDVKAYGSAICMILLDACKVRRDLR